MGNILLGFFLLLFGFFLPAQGFSESISVEKKGGVYELPVRLNGVITLDFILDTGSAEMNLPADVVATLVRTGTLNQDDFLPSKVYVLADGTRKESSRVLIRAIQIGNRTLRNVPASISDVEGQLLLGQNLLDKVGAYTIDSRTHTIVLHEQEDDREADTEVIENTATPSPQLWKSFSQGLEKEAQPESVVANFFSAVAEEKFDEGWKLLSLYSQKEIVRMVAEEAESSPQIIEELFEENHPSIQEGFWRSFKNTSKISQVSSQAKFKTLKNVSGLATVQVSVGSNLVDFEVYQESGEWKMGLIETLEANRKMAENK